MKANATTVRVWDPFVRIFHWSLVGCVCGSFVTAGRFRDAHFPIGYAIMALVTCRIVWGFVGTKHARFSDFVYGPSAVVAYLKSLTTGKPIHYLGHNPAGGLMVLTLLCWVPLTAGLGLLALAYGGEGPLAGFAGMDRFSPLLGHGLSWWEIHKIAAFTLAGFVAFHLGGVVVSSWLHRENLVLAMITGNKEIPTRIPPKPRPKKKRPGRRKR